MKNKIIRNILLVIVAIAIIYLGFGIYFGSHFFFNSTVNGVPAGKHYQYLGLRERGVEK